MTEEDIINSINWLNSDICNLTNERIMYENMNRKINQAISNLELGKSSVVNSFTELGRSYSSEVANKKVAEIRGESDKISAIISELRGSILPASNSQINSLNMRISNDQSQIWSLNVQLQELQQNKG